MKRSSLVPPSVMAILASGLMIVAITWGAPNQIGTQTFAVLWVMRISAKLNVFLSVRDALTAAPWRANGNQPGRHLLG